MTKIGEWDPCWDGCMCELRSIPASVIRLGFQVASASRPAAMLTSSPALHLLSTSVLRLCHSLYYSSAIDQTKKKVTLLSPLPGRLPRKTLILGSLDWQDS